MFSPEKLKKAREEKGLSPTDLNFELVKVNLRVSRQTIMNWENGNTVPDANDMSLIAKYFNKPMEDFFN